MHLKTILIVYLMCFFNGITNEGLNLRQIELFEALIFSKHGKKMYKIKDALIGHNIQETYNDYKLDDKFSVRIFKILKFLVKVKKTGDDKKAEKLDINDVEIISNVFCNLDTDNDGLINKEKFITLIDSIGYCSSTGNVVTLNENNNEKLKSTLVDMKKNINDQKHTLYRFNDVLITILFYKAKFKNTYFVCFLTDTMGDGLNAIQIQCLQILVKKYNDKDKINKVIKAFNVIEEYKYKPADTEHKRVYDILHFMHTFDKTGDKIILTGDGHPIIKLNINVLNRVFKTCSSLNINNDGVIENENYHQLIDSLGFSGLINDILEKNTE
ncbi:uncharacterized protein LOC126905977 isoform X4 [Daktulosphaira vitifoliae]|uniref:uncharacterized protein LOC126905977 isoform X4 n=1 Tax=Daktulosphaira vitifoliae TaxID=58002 RepID=UPI0021AA5EAF|nr:uncharacterized protein LOC126905977 isoform X4 [Daktulosphaira vitifoliae]